MSNKSILRSVLSLLGIAVLSVILPYPVFAQAPSLSASTVSGATQIAAVLFSVLQFLSWFLLSVLELLMDPQFMFGMNMQGNGELNMNLVNMLREIWQFTRDLVNLGFALALIIGAVIMIVTADGTKMKEHLFKFVIGLVLVNFSWFIPRVIFDASQVLTYTIYQIPSLLGADNCVMPAQPGDREPRQCEVVTQFRFLSEADRIGTVAEPDGSFRGTDGSTGWRCPLRGLVCIQKVPMNQADAQVRLPTKIFHGLVVNHARLQWLGQIQPAAFEAQERPGERLTTTFMRLSGTLVKLVIVLLIQIAIVFPLLAMAAAFFIRIPVIWVSIAFMPLVALGFAFPKLREGEYGDLFWKWQEHFLQAVFLPAKVAVPFVIGFIMLNAGAQLQPPDNLGNIPILPVFVGIRDMWQFLWMGIALFIIWKYSFDALKSDRAGFMGHFTEKIQGIGSSLGSIAAQWPLSMPLIPVPGRRDKEGKQEFMSIQQGLRGIDPRAIRQDLEATGRLDRGTFARTARLQGGAPRNEAAVKQINSNTTNVIATINTTQFTRALRTGESAANVNTQLDQAFTQLRENFTTLNPMTDSEIVGQLFAAGRIDQSRHDLLLQLLRNNNRMDRRGPTPAPTPAPGGTTP